MIAKPEEFTGEKKLYVPKRQPRNAFGDQGAEADIEEAGLSEEEVDSSAVATAKADQTAPGATAATMTPTPDPVPTMATRTTSIEESCDEIDGAGSPRRPETASPVVTLGKGAADSLTNDSPKRRRTDMEEAALFNT